jgi:tryptophan 2,3-dioxygenase
LSASTSAETRGDGDPENVAAATSGKAMTADGSNDTAYRTYLELDTLLAIQRPKTDQHDELLFVIVHQIHELWFKQLLHELGAAQRSLASAADGPALRALRRTRSIIRVLITQIDVLESITPEQFDGFRELLGGSGHQSAQFREIEVVFGRRDRGAAEQFSPGSPDRKRIEARLGEPALFDSLIRYLAASGYLPTPRGARVVPDSPEIRQALRAAYREDGVAAQICERFVDLDQLLQEWRFRHAVLARRVIGDKTGTGGSSGAEYLRESVFRPSFPALWQVRDTVWAAE